MNLAAEKYLFNRGHMWCRVVEGTVFLVGISDHAQQSLGEITYIELPDCGGNIAQGNELGIIESIKVVNDLISPLSGTVLEVNEALVALPGTVNVSPYEDAWMLRVKADSIAELDALMDHAAYIEYLG
jgi:glycine cleavage system H protein